MIRHSVQSVTTAGRALNPGMALGPGHLGMPGFTTKNARPCGHPPTIWHPVSIKIMARKIHIFPRAPDFLSPTTAVTVGHRSVRRPWCSAPELFRAPNLSEEDRRHGLVRTDPPDKNVSKAHVLRKASPGSPVQPSSDRLRLSCAVSPTDRRFSPLHHYGSIFEPCQLSTLNLGLHAPS